MVNTFLCPCCSLPVPKHGVVDIDGQPSGVYQCPTCIVRADTMGGTSRFHHTFLVNQQGEPFDLSAPPTLLN